MHLSFKYVTKFRTITNTDKQGLIRIPGHTFFSPGTRIPGNSWQNLQEFLVMSQCSPGPFLVQFGCDSLPNHSHQEWPGMKTIPCKFTRNTWLSVKCSTKRDIGSTSAHAADFLWGNWSKCTSRRNNGAALRTHRYQYTLATHPEHWTISKHSKRTRSSN